MSANLVNLNTNPCKMCMAGILAAVDDCKGVLALRIGESPLKKLETRGIRVFTLYENVDKAVNDAARALCG